MAQVDFKLEYFSSQDLLLRQAIACRVKSRHLEFGFVNYPKTHTHISLAILQASERHQINKLKRVFHVLRMFL
jgi:hypothetical protein